VLDKVFPLFNSINEDMNNVDLTTINSAEAALELQKFDDQKHAYFVYSLVSLTNAFLEGTEINISKPLPSKETTIRNRGQFVSFLKDKSLINDFSKIEDQSKFESMAKTFDWLSGKLDDMRLLAFDESFWKKAHVKEWLKWHEAERPIHEEAVGGSNEVSLDKFILENLSIDRNDYERRFTFDVIIRGFYYHDLHKGNIWLHPIRISQLDKPEPNNILEYNTQKQVAVELIIGLLMSRKFNSKEDRISFWTQSIKQAKIYFDGLKTSSHLPINDTEKVIDDLADKFGIMKWKELLSEQKPILDWIVNPAAIMTQAFLNPVVATTIQLIAYYTTTFLPDIGDFIDKSISNKVQSKGKRKIMAISNIALRP
jgi:hypothetical protein